MSNITAISKNEVEVFWVRIRASVGAMGSTFPQPLVEAEVLAKTPKTITLRMIAPKGQMLPQHLELLTYHIDDIELVEKKAGVA